jgi:hypothetical protein
MMAKALSGFSHNDILFLVETVDSQLVARVDTLKNDPAIIEGMLDQEVDRVFERITLMSEEKAVAGISPRFLFEVMLRKTLRELQSQSYTVERTASQKIPVFDAGAVAEFLANRSILKYLADMLSSFTRIESYAIPLRVRKGIWRKIRFNDMDVDCLIGICEVADEERRFGFYKRIGDVCLFISGMFPEYVHLDCCYPSLGEPRPKTAGRLGRGMEEYEEEGRRFYKLAAEHRTARTLELTDVFWLLHGNFNAARKPLNFISEHYLHHRRHRLFEMGAQ